MGYNVCRWRLISAFSDQAELPRHCERSEATQGLHHAAPGLLRRFAPRNDDPARSDTPRALDHPGAFELSAPGERPRARRPAANRNRARRPAPDSSRINQRAKTYRLPRQSRRGLWLTAVAVLFAPCFTAAFAFPPAARFGL